MSHKKLNELEATAICGNDISSSVLYVSALAISFAGQYAWITLGIVAAVLFFFRKIYGEVVGALPLNGGAYNALLNTTSKQMASLAAALTLLSYMATAVISSSEAMHYLSSIIHSMHHPIFHGIAALEWITYVELSTFGLLTVFAMLAINGISESAKVAIFIFIFHLVSLVLLTGAILFFMFRHGFDQLAENWHHVFEGGSVRHAVLLGFAASMLGISGFESSANFVEEQEHGVFPKTLRNMWIVVSVFNPLMAFLAIVLLPIPEISTTYKTTLLSQMGRMSAGEWLAILVSIDAVLVLSGAVLTSFVGVTGLLERMTLDRIMPQYFLKRNKKGASYRIILMFLLLSFSVLIITQGKVDTLAGVYTLSFLSVMGLFIAGNILLKARRKKLPRPEKAPYYGLAFAFAGVMVALYGNIIMAPKPGNEANYAVFLQYFVPTMIFVGVMLNRTVLLNGLLSLVQYIFKPIQRGMGSLNMKIIETVDKINDQEFVFFTKGDNVATLNKVMIYIKENEHTNHIKIVHVHPPGQRSPEILKSDLKVLDRAYPKINIEFLEIEGTFGPEFIKKFSKKYNVPINFMFIGSPGDRFPYRLEELGGVRLIM